MNASFALHLAVAVSVALLVVRHWRVVVAAVAAMVLALAVFGLMTVLSNLHVLTG